MLKPLQIPGTSRGRWAGLLRSVLTTALLGVAAAPAWAQYCVTGLGGFCGGNDITAVSISGTTLNATGLTCTSAGGQAYTSYPATAPANTATLSGGVPYQLSVTTTGASIISVWIDYNRNNTYEASEWTQVATNSAANAAATVNLIVPANAAQGTTGMRIRSRSSGNTNGAGDACTNFGSGETKDFTVTIGAPAACPAVTGVTATGITGSAATINFTGGSAATGYTVTYTPQGGTATTVTPAPTGSPITLTGLTPSTQYTVRIVANCGGGQTSAPNTVTFTTGCAAAPYALVNNTTPYTQDFEATWQSVCGTNDVPSPNFRNTPVTGNQSWRREDDGASAGWTSPTFGAYTPTGSTLNGATGTHSARFHSSYAPSRSVGTLDLYLNMAGTTGTPVLNFDYVNTSGSDSLRVLVSTNGGATFGAPIGAFTTNSGWTRQAVNLPSTGLTATTVVRLRGSADFGSTDIGVDNLRVSYVTCPAVTNVAVSGISATAASVTFGTTTATGYTVTYTPQGGTATTVTPAPTGSPVNLTGLTANTTYTVSIVANCGGGQTSAPTTVTFTTNPTPATNDDCAQAVSVPVTTACTTPTTGTVLGATQSLAPTTNCGFGVTAANDVWYSFVATGTTHTVTLNSQFSSVLDVRSGNCTTSTSLYCNTASSGFPRAANIGGLTAGQTYYIRVYASGTQPTGPASTFTLCVNPGPVAPANDECAGAINLPVQFGTCTTPVVGNNTGATASAGAPAPTCANYQGGDIWFQVTVPATGAVTVATSAPTGGSSVTDTGMSVYSGTCASLTEVQCNDDANSTLYSQVALTGRTPGEVLYVRVWSYGNNAQGPIAVCATSPSNCAVPTSPTASNVTNTTAQLNWTRGGTQTTGVSYEIEYGVQGFTLGTGTAVTGLTNPTYALTNLAPNTNYCFYVRQNCGTANGSSTYVGPICFQTTLTAPANDDPCGALALGNGTVSGTNVGATTTTQSSIQLPACTPAQLPKDVWFTFVPTGTSVSLTFTGTAAGMARLYTAPSCSAGPFTQVGCQAASAANTGFTAPVVFSGLTARTRYYLAVSGYGSSDTPGSFTIQASALGNRVQAEAASLTVAPNPSNTGQLTVRLQTLGAAFGSTQLLLYNALGQVALAQPVRLSTAGTLEQTLDVHNLATGVYTLRVQVGEQVLTRKVVLE